MNENDFNNIFTGSSKLDVDKAREQDDARRIDNMNQEDAWQDMQAAEAWYNHQDEQLEREQDYILRYLRDFTIDVQLADTHGCTKLPWPAEAMAEALQAAEDADNHRLYSLLAAEPRDINKIGLAMFDIVIDHYRQVYRDGEL